MPASIPQQIQVSSSSNKGHRPHHILTPAWEGDQVLDDLSFLTAKQRNSLVKMQNGNRRGNGIKILHWNKGPAHLVNKHHDIEAVISEHTPQVLGLSEANLHSRHDLMDVQHDDYDLHVSSTIDNPLLKVARVVVYTHQSLKVVRRHDLEDDTVSSVWLECGLPRQKKILICHAYREWQYLNQDNAASGTLAAQKERWSALLSQWELAISEDKEVMVMMDANIDFLRWNDPNPHPNSSIARTRPLAEELFSRIFPHGVSQLVTVPTRSWPGQPDTGIDHVYTNKPDKLSDVQVKYQGG